MIRLKENYGFTLVELAVVMIIIGVLIGGVLKGQEMIQGARVTKTASNLESFTAAHNIFYDQFGALPGDINGLGRLPGCTLANFCASGNLDTVVGVPIDNANNNTAGELAESIQYWKHLAMTGIISGVNPAASNIPANSSIGQSHPGTPLGGVYNAFETDPAGFNDYGAPGVNIVITQMPNVTTTAGAFLSMMHVSQIDLRLDDGAPNTGTVTAEYQSQNCDNGNGPNAPQNQYTGDPTGRCILYYSMGF